jgi:hypothetical protein
LDGVEESPEFPARWEPCEIQRGRNQNEESIAGNEWHPVLFTGNPWFGRGASHPETGCSGDRQRQPSRDRLFTAAIVSTEPNSSDATVDVQYVRIVKKPVIPAIG